MLEALAYWDGQPVPWHDGGGRGEAAESVQPAPSVKGIVAA